jgi:hypothetical protein
VDFGFRNHPQYVIKILSLKFFTKQKKMANRPTPRLRMECQAAVVATLMHGIVPSSRASQSKLQMLSMDWLKEIQPKTKVFPQM